ncbi:hypothetical protein HGM15179_020055 [Zosterops borbonicus]|uniref:Uncharacterized protein n=1 Tax=Zosterops borbonicus TaxID=364589 RepID=A0A8K1D8R9_9PASS|nr:hypothetical protein HGM15179_020055 [Zosterops borbonicus]
MRLLLTANTHMSCVLLSCVVLEVYLITFLPLESWPLRTVRNARLISRMIWMLVAAECALFVMDDNLRASSSLGQLFQLSSLAATLLRFF